jgi:hypothetical protein
MQSVCLGVVIFIFCAIAIAAIVAVVWLASSVISNTTTSPTHHPEADRPIYHDQRLDLRTSRRHSRDADTVIDSVESNTDELVNDTHFDNKGERVCHKQVRSFEGGYGRIRLFADDISAILDSMSDANRNKLTVTSARASKEASARPGSERKRAIEKLNGSKPELSISNTSRGTNADYATLHFNDKSVYFPDALIIDVCLQ